jgi:hypothetical protein
MQAAIGDMFTYLVMLFPIRLCVLLSLLSHVLLHGWIYEKFLGDRVAGQLPCELVAIACNVVNIVRIIDNLIVVCL